jgi:acyl-CoA thioesterase YciA
MAAAKKATEPTGTLAVQTLAMPANTNANGDIFGGWLVSQMDLAAGVIAKQRSKGRTVTIAIDSMVFHRPVKVGDLVSCYAELIRVGRTSMEIAVEVWVIGQVSGDRHQVTEGIFTFVAIDAKGRKRAIPQDDD